MARLISPPTLPVVAIEPLTGPRSIGAGSSQSVDGFVQTVASPFGAWRFKFSFSAMRKDQFRRYRGWVAALHGGANATRWDFWDPDMMSPREAGIDVAADVEWTSSGVDQPWANNMSWSNQCGWELTPPTVHVATQAEINSTVVELSDAFWGHRLDMGDYIGFSPFHFGLYLVTEVIEPGKYRVWPPLRKSVSSSDFATLRPTLAMRLESEEAASAGRGLSVAEGCSVTLVEVFDYDARDYFAD